MRFNRIIEWIIQIGIWGAVFTFLKNAPGASYQLFYLCQQTAELKAWYPNSGDMFYTLGSCFESILCLLSLQILFVLSFFRKRKPKGSHKNPKFHTLYAAFLTFLIIDEFRCGWSMFSWCFFESEWNGALIVLMGWFCSFLSSCFLIFFCLCQLNQEEKPLNALWKISFLIILTTLLDVQVRNLLCYSESFIFLLSGFEINPETLSLVNRKFLESFGAWFCWCAPEEPCTKEKIYKETVCSSSKLMKLVKTAGGNPAQRVVGGFLKYETEQQLAQYCQKLTEDLQNCIRNSNK